MNILAIDYGAKRIGLAWVDTALGVVLPFGMIRQSDFTRLPRPGPPASEFAPPANAWHWPAGRRRSRAGAEATGGQGLQIAEIATLVKREKIGQIVMGLPIGLDGQENENTKKVREFADQLKSEVRLPIITVDERFTTHEAGRMKGGVSVDEKAAMIILQTYLDKRKAES